MKKQSFVWGAIILMIANAVSKILGAVFKIPLTYILEEEGMAIYNSAFQIYALFLSFVISGIPFTIAKLVSEYSATGEGGKVKLVVKISALMLCALGVLGSVLLYFGADFFALAMKEDRATFAIRMLSPSVFFVAIGCIYKSYFQGKANMIPTALSQVIEAIIKLAAGYISAVIFIKAGVKIAAGGAALGVSVGEGISAVMLFFFYKFSKKDSALPEGGKEVFEKILSIAFPLLIASVISSMLSVVDTSLLRRRLIDYGHSIEEARFIYGAYTGYALTVFHLPVGIMATFGVSILPVIAGALASGNVTRAKSTTALAIKLNVILGLPCAVAIYFLGEDLLMALFKNAYSAQMLSMTAPCVVFLCVAQICTSILNSAGKIMLSFSIGAIASLLKTVFAYFLVERMSIYGNIISANIAFFAYMVMSLFAIKKIIGLKFNFMEIIIKPIASVIVMILVLVVLAEPLCVLFENIYLRLFLLALLSGIAYVLSLMLFGGVSLQEVKKAVAK